MHKFAEQLRRVDAHLPLGLLCEALLADLVRKVVRQVVDDKGHPGHDVLLDLLSLILPRRLEVLVQLNLIVRLILQGRGLDHLHTIMSDPIFPRRLFLRWEVCSILASNVSQNVLQAVLLVG